MSNNSWLKAEASRAKQKTESWPDWRKEIVKNSNPYGYSDAGHRSSSKQKEAVARPNIITLILEDLDDATSRLLEEYIVELEEYKFMYEGLED